LSQTFGISAPRMAVRTHLSWRWRLPALFGLAALIAGMWWWGFDFGQFLGGFNRSAVAERQARLESDADSARNENTQLRARLAELESDLNVTRGAQATLSRQALELQNENTQMKEELAFLRTLFNDTGKPGTVTIQRLTAERDRDDVYRFSMLVVRAAGYGNGA
jgi:septal ring factor EnvC (AmiA/AmiB activator)